MSAKEQKKSEIKQSRNRRYKSLIKNQIKQFESYLKSNEKNDQELKKMVSQVQKTLDKASNKKIIHKNKAARKKSKLHKLISTNNKNSISG